MAYVSGMLWFDNKGTLVERISRAIAHYQDKFGSVPTVVQVNPADAQGALPGDVCGVEVIPTSSMCKNHCLVGCVS